MRRRIIPGPVGQNEERAGLDWPGEEQRGNARGGNPLLFTLIINLVNFTKLVKNRAEL